MLLMGSSAEERTNDLEDIKIKTSQTEIWETDKQTTTKRENVAFQCNNSQEYPIIIGRLQTTDPGSSEPNMVIPQNIHLSILFRLQKTTDKRKNLEKPPYL